MHIPHHCAQYYEQDFHGVCKFYCMNELLDVYMYFQCIH